MLRRLVRGLTFVGLVLVTSRTGWSQEPRPRPDNPPLAFVDRSGLFFDAAVQPLDQVQIAGLPPGSQPVLLTWKRVYQLALIHSRTTPPPRLEALNPNFLDDQARTLGLDDFAQFRDDFLKPQAFHDPAASFLDLQARLMQIDEERLNLALNERWDSLLKDLLQGEATGRSKLDLDQSSAAVIAARRELDRSIAEYRDRLDLLKVMLGLAPRARVTIDLVPLAMFREFSESMNRWCCSPTRELSDLVMIAGKLPPIGDVIIGNRPILFEVEQDPNRLEEILTLATQVALERPHAAAETADAVELRVRRRIRHLIEIRKDYLVALRSVVLAFCRLDDTFEQIISPPAVAFPSRPGSGLEALKDHARQIAETRGRLVALWTTFLAERVALDRDLGRLPFADWPTFFGQFALEPIQIKPALPAEPSPLAPPPPVPLPFDPGA